MKRYLSWSGGKDSSASIALCYEKGIHLDGVVMSEVMFDHKRGISGEEPKHIKWVYEIAIPVIENMGYHTEIIKGKRDYLTLFNSRINSKDGERNGKKCGWLLGGMCAANSRLKVRPLESFFKSTPSQTILTNRAADGSFTAYLSEGEDWIAVGRVTSVQHGGLPFHKAEPSIGHLLPKEGVVVAAMPGPGEGGTLTVAVWGAPEEAVSGTMELDLIDVDGGLWPAPDEETFTAQATREDNGWFFFRFSPHKDHPGQELCAIDALWEWDARIVYGFVGEHPYRLTLTGAGGTEVLARSGTLPPNQRLIDR